jgi:hypothetical protein
MANVEEFQQDWYRFAAHACEQHRYINQVVKKIVDADPEDETEFVNAENHYYDEPADDYFLMDRDDAMDKRTFTRIMRFYKDVGYEPIHNSVLKRASAFNSKAKEQKESAIKASKDSENTQDSEECEESEDDETDTEMYESDAESMANVMLQTFLDLPRLNRPFTCYRAHNHRRQ